VSRTSSVRTPSGIVQSYEKVMTIFRKHSPMSNWNELTTALGELGNSIHGRSR